MKLIAILNALVELIYALNKLWVYAVAKKQETTRKKINEAISNTLSVDAARKRLQRRSIKTTDLK